MKKIALSCGIGNAIEWYDFVVYGYFVTIIGILFFPESSKYAQTIMVFGTFAAGFIARPIGALIFGRIGDRSSRKKALAASIYVMAIPTALIGVLPTFETIGIAAPFILIALRIIQGLAIGGEFTGSMIFLVEHSPKDKKGFYSSIATFSAVVGVICGSATVSALFYLLDDADMKAFGWRIPFLISAFGGIVGSYIRRAISDPEESKQSLNNQKTPALKSLLKTYWSPMLKVILLDFLTAIGFFIVVVFIANYMEKYSNLREYAQYVNTISMFVFAAFCILGGYLADKIGIKKVMSTSCILFILFSYSLFTLFQCGSTSFLFPLLAHSAMSMFMGLFFGALPLALTSLFPVSVRFSCISLSHNISMAIFGGTTPLAATILLDTTNNPNSPALLLIIASSLSFLGLLSIKDTLESKKIISEQDIRAGRKA